MALVQVLNCTDTCSSSSSALRRGVSREESEWIEEARCLMLVSHRSVVHLVGVVATSRPMYIVTELATHGCLKDCLRHSNVFLQSDVSTLLGLCTQVVTLLGLCTHAVTLLGLSTHLVTLLGLCTQVVTVLDL